MHSRPLKRYQHPGNFNRKLFHCHPSVSRRCRKLTCCCRMPNGSWMALLPFYRKMVTPHYFKIFRRTIFPIMAIGSSSTLPSGDFTDPMEERIKPQLSSIAGVGRSTHWGVRKEIRVQPEKDKLEQYGISILQVVQVVEASNLDFPTGKIRTKTSRFSSAWQVEIPVGGRLANWWSPLTKMVLPSACTRSLKSRIQKEIEDLNRVDGDVHRVEHPETVRCQCCDVSKAIQEKLKELEGQYARKNWRSRLRQTVLTLLSMRWKQCSTTSFGHHFSGGGRICFSAQLPQRPYQ